MTFDQTIKRLAGIMPVYGAYMSLKTSDGIFIGLIAGVAISGFIFGLLYLKNKIIKTWGRRIIWPSKPQQTPSNHQAIR